MQALNSSQNSNNSINTSSSEDCHQEQQCSSDQIATSCDPMATSCGSIENNTSPSVTNHVENTIVNNQQQHINNNTIAINNNNCDTIKNNNQVVTATTATTTTLSHLPASATPIEMANEVEAAPAMALIDQQSALLRGVNMGKWKFMRHTQVIVDFSLNTKISFFSFFVSFLPSFFPPTRFEIYCYNSWHVG